MKKLLFMGAVLAGTSISAYGQTEVISKGETFMLKEEKRSIKLDGEVVLWDEVAGKITYLEYETGMEKSLETKYLINEYYVNGELYLVGKPPNGATSIWLAGNR